MSLRIFLLLLLFVSPLSAQKTLFRQVAHTPSDTHVEVTALFSEISPGGYVPIRVTMANRQKISHKIYLSFEDTSNYQDSIVTQSKYLFDVPAGETQVAELVVPLRPHNGQYNYGNLKVSLSGSMGKIEDSLQMEFEDGLPVVLLSSELYSRHASALDAEASTRNGSKGSDVTFSARFDPKQLPDDWRAYSGYDSIILTETDWSNVPPGAKNAIISWLRLGGQLVIYTPRTQSLGTAELPADPGFGQILTPKFLQDSKININECVDIAYKKRTSKSRIKAIEDDFLSGWPLPALIGEKSFNYISFIIVLLGFGILVGPVNLFVFAKSGMRHRLFITTPLISIGTSLLLIVLIIFEDGFGGKGAQLTLMEVSSDTNVAYVHQEQFSRTGVMTMASFQVDSPVLLAQVPIEKNRWARFTNDYDTAGVYDLQPKSGGLFAKGDWFQSRSEQAQLITAVTPTRGRIEATGEENRVISRYHFPIETLLYQDRSGQWYRADYVTTGKVVSLVTMDGVDANKLIQKTMKQLSERNRQYLRQASKRMDSYIALAKGAPSISTHPDISWEKASIITGLLSR